MARTCVIVYTIEFVSILKASSKRIVYRVISKHEYC